jgi:hypothetical protein
MASMFSSNANSVISRLQRKKDVPTKLVRDFVIKAVNFVHEGVTDRTAVHTGQSLRNWQWTQGTPYSGELPDPGGVEPGQTSRMTIGSEPRRPAAQADSDASKDALDFKNPFDVYYLTNNHKEIIELEYGRLPTPDRSRNPAGMVRITFAELETVIRGMM